MIIRVQGPDKIMRIEVETSLHVKELKKIIAARANTENPILTLADRKPMEEGNISDYNLENGSIIHAEYKVREKEEEEGAAQGAEEWRAEKGEEESSDEKKCDHPPSAVCLKCAAPDIWSQSLYKKAHINYLSFKAYREMLKSERKEDVELGSRLVAPCSNHGKGSKCASCMPTSLVLAPQPFRVVEHVEFSDRAMVDELIDKWRGTGKQVFGYLVGRYEPFEKVPEGVKASVSLIHFPTQTNFPDGFVIEEDMEDSAKRVIRDLGLEVLGMVYTDINRVDGKITSERSECGYIVSSLEAKFIAEMQFERPFVVDGKARGSRFVTIIIAGDKSAGGAEVSEYMVSNQCMELCRDGLIAPTQDPTLFARTEKSYSHISEVYYGLDASEDAEEPHGEKRKRIKTVTADPYFPVEFMLVRLTHGFLEAPRGFLIGTKSFHRESEVGGLKKHFKTNYQESEGVHNISLRCLSNFEVLLFLVEKDLLSEEDYARVVACVKSADQDGVVALLAGGHLAKLVELMRDNENKTWNCSVCTLLNNGARDTCEACGIPRQSE